eukprot:767579-Hanusia_phi.AAC.3
MAKYAALDNKYKAENNELSESYQLDQSEAAEMLAGRQGASFSSLSRFLTRTLQIIHEQQLGLLWFPPNEEELNKVFTKFREREFEKVMARMRKEAGRDGLSQSEDMSWDAVLKSQLVESPVVELLVLSNSYSSPPLRPSRTCAR